MSPAKQAWELLCSNQLLDFDEYRLIWGPVLGVFAHVHVTYSAFLIEDEDRRMSYAAVLGRVHDSVFSDRFLFDVGEDLELGAGGLCHRPRVGLLIDADSDQFPARLFYLVVVLSQPGELLCARASPEASVENKHDGRSLCVLGENHQLAVAVGQREVRSLGANL